MFKDIKIVPVLLVFSFCLSVLYFTKEKTLMSNRKLSKLGQCFRNNHLGLIYKIISEKEGQLFAVVIKRAPSSNNNTKLSLGFPTRKELHNSSFLGPEIYPVPCPSASFEATNHSLGQ